MSKKTYFESKKNADDFWLLIRLTTYTPNLRAKEQISFDWWLSKGDLDGRTQRA